MVDDFINRNDSCQNIVSEDDYDYGGYVDGEVSLLVNQVSDYVSRG